jgi:hypothetical protein
MQPAGEDLRIVQDKEVSRKKISSKFREHLMNNGAGLTVQDQKPGPIAVLRWRLSDELFREVKIEIRQAEMFQYR